MAFSQSREIIELLKITTPDKIITLRHEKSYKFLFDTLKKS